MAELAREDAALARHRRPTRSSRSTSMSVIDRVAADDAILTCDSGTIATWAARHFTIRGEREFFLSGNLATMAPGLPYAIARSWRTRAANASLSSATAGSPC